MRKSADKYPCGREGTAGQGRRRETRTSPRAGPSRVLAQLARGAAVGLGNIERNVERIVSGSSPHVPNCRTFGRQDELSNREHPDSFSRALSASSSAELADSAGDSARHSYAGGGTRTPDTRIMIPLL